MLNSEFVHCMRTAFNPFMPNGISHRYQLKQSISVLRDVRWYFSFFKLCKQTETLCWTVTSDLGLHYLPMSQKKDARHIWVKNAIILLISKELQKFGKYIVEIIFLLKVH